MHVSTLFADPRTDPVEGECHDSVVLHQSYGQGLQRVGNTAARLAALTPRLKPTATPQKILRQLALFARTHRGPPVESRQRSKSARTIHADLPEVRREGTVMKESTFAEEVLRHVPDTPPVFPQATYD